MVNQNDMTLCKEFLVRLILGPTVGLDTPDAINLIV